MTYTVFAGHGYSFFTVFTSNAYLAICAVRRIWACDGYAILTIFTNFNSPFIAVDFNLVASFDCTCIAIDSDLFLRIGAQCYLVFKTYFIVFGTIRIVAWRNLNIIARCYRRSRSSCSLIQLRFIDCISWSCTSSYIRNLVTTIIQTIFS